MARHHESSELTMVQAETIHATATDPTAGEWPIPDAVIQLREMFTHRVHALPPPPIMECTLGADESCAVHIDDPMNRVSRVHGWLSRDKQEWMMRDCGSKNGIWVNGARRKEIELRAGFEFRVGSVYLLSESLHSIAMRGFLARLLGWSRMDVLDNALHAVCLAAARESALILCGQGDLVPIAQAIHRRMYGKRPFMVCDPRRQSNDGTVRAAPNRVKLAEALLSATNGSLCMIANHLPDNFRELVDTLRGKGLDVQLIICAESMDLCDVYRAQPLVIRPLAERAAELDRIIDEYAQDALTELAPQSEFPVADRAWIRKHSATSLPEIEKGTRRLVALRASRSLHKAAGRLEMSHVSLSRWIGRRALPMKLE